jgi:hypothetical protein
MVGLPLQELPVNPSSEQIIGRKIQPRRQAQWRLQLAPTWQKRRCLEVAASSRKAVAELCQGNDHPLPQGRSAAIAQPVHDAPEKQRINAGQSAEVVGIAKTRVNAHLRVLRVRGALRFSRSSKPLMRMSAKLRSAVRAA